MSEEFADSHFYHVLHEDEIVILNNTVKKIIGLATARDLIRNCKNYTFNRVCVVKHVETIKEDLLNMEHPHLIGTFKIICNSTGEYYIFDGQHRYNAIFEILGDDLNMEWDINIYIEIYFINHEDIETNPVTSELFKMANKTLSFDFANDTPDEYLQKLINTLCKDPLFCNNIVNKNKVNRPRISKYELVQEFKKTFKLTVNPPIEKVIDLIKTINNDLSINKEKAIGKFKRTDVYKKREEAYNKAVEKKFLLNLEYYSPVMWINDLLLKLNESV